MREQLLCILCNLFKLLYISCNNDAGTGVTGTNRTFENC